jgi:hypothetical protein
MQGAIGVPAVGAKIRQMLLKEWGRNNFPKWSLADK